ncbi:acyltransferase family-domain-containing protein [Podospora appendiculata]|uniref:Acyltransferase family-domain-containing protein n=1 Tax=Podospora appendiculata TaxID=314037 RepID=A0AAE0X7S9_9PEZI|nr:acyltransferase family-domain-containing protein [Podospora appendiculata]
MFLSSAFPPVARWGGGLYSLVTAQPHDDDSEDELAFHDFENEKSASWWAPRWAWSRREWHRMSLSLRSQVQGSSWLMLVLFILASCSRRVAFCLPSFIPSLYNRFRLSKASSAAAAGGPTRDKPLSPTAYLDGLRGVAALTVYIFHFGYLWFPVLRNGYGSTDSDHLIWQLPVLRALHSGRASVTVFFVISGYVLSLRTLTIIYNGQTDKVLDALAGSVFRRPFRLYLPIVVSTGIAAVLTRFNNVFIPNIGGGEIPPEQPTSSQQFWHWLEVTIKTINPFRSLTGRQNLWGNDYNGHLWTIPFEFKGSLLVFFLLLAFSRSRRSISFVGVSIAAYWQMVSGDFDQTLFCAGLLLAELSLILPPAIFGLKLSPSGRRSAYILQHALTIALFITSLHFLSYPENHGPSSPGFRTISSLVPAFYDGNEERIQQFWISVGAITLVVALMYSPAVSRRRSDATDLDLELDEEQQPRPSAADLSSRNAPPQSEPLLQRLFTNAFAQYLGQISYSLYLWHGSINHIVGMRYLHPAWAAWEAGEAGAKGLAESGFEAAAAAVLDTIRREYIWKWAWGMVVNTFILFWVSDVFHRAVDMPAVRVTRTIQRWALARK